MLDAGEFPEFIRPELTGQSAGDEKQDFPIRLRGYLAGALAKKLKFSPSRSLLESLVFAVITEEHDNCLPSRDMHDLRRYLLEEKISVPDCAKTAEMLRFHLNDAGYPVAVVLFVARQPEDANDPVMVKEESQFVTFTKINNVYYGIDQAAWYYGGKEHPWFYIVEGDTLSTVFDALVLYFRTPQSEDRFDRSTWTTRQSREKTLDSIEKELSQSPTI